MPAPKSLLKGFARTIAFAKPDPKKRVTLFDPDTRGLCVRITSKGRKTYTIVARNPAGRQVWSALPNGDADDIPLEEARELAREGVRRIKAGLDAFPALETPVAPESFGAVTQNFIKRHVRKNGLRSAPEIERVFNRYILPEWRHRPFVEIRRSDVTRLLDYVEDNHGATQADRVLAAISQLANWYASRSDDYSSPIIRGMRRTSTKNRARKRILSHDEIQSLWPVLDDAGRYGALVKVLLLTAQRRAKVAAMKWSDIAADGTWTIATEAREKNNPGDLRLPESALAIIRAQTPIGGNPYMFPSKQGDGPIAGFANFKSALDAKVAKVEPIEHWTLHDVRRTARSLMAEAGVRPDIAERVMGHAITGVEGVYDRHSYIEEKAKALEKLATLVERIVNPPAENVVALHGAAK